MFTPDMKGKKVFIELTLEEPEEFNEIMEYLSSGKLLMGATLENVGWDNKGREVIDSVRTMVNHMREMGIVV